MSPKHGIASSSAYGARCFCGLIERSVFGRLEALKQIVAHLEDMEEAE